MIFRVTGRFPHISSSQVDTAFLTIDNWNDYSYYTLYGIIYVDSHGNRHDLGSVRIAYYGQQTGIAERKFEVGEEFSELNSEFFSLGAGTDYYESLNKLDPETRETILVGLRDMAFSPEIFEEAEHEEIATISLMRGIDKGTVTGQYYRMAHGGAKLTKFQFWFESPKITAESPEMRLAFKVTPESNPPTNIHVLIGRNGVGKTHMINHMVASLYGTQFEDARGVYFQEDKEKFVNVVYVSFSAFDTSVPLFDTISEYTRIQFRYIGLKLADNSGLGFRIKNTQELADEFVGSFINCMETFKSESLRMALHALESDPNFKQANISQLFDFRKKRIISAGTELFNKLSSGHKIILLSITRLVETVQEKSLVFIDEPEAHLHPPLLSAFIRSLSELLVNVNGVAIIATHSPVILQEVPRTCVYKLRRFGANAFAERPDVESFGENVGVLTREVFGLEVTDSGFYQLLKKAVTKLDGYEDLLEHFGDNLGMEARSIARVLFNNKNKETR